MRMTLPKKEEDLQKVVEEVMESHGHDHDHHHHHHHHGGELDEILRTIDVLIDTMNTRVTDLEEKFEKIREEIINLYLLFGEIVKAMAARTEDEKAAALRRAREIIEKGLSSLGAAS